MKRVKGYEIIWHMSNQSPRGENRIEENWRDNGWEFSKIGEIYQLSFMPSRIY